MLRPKMMEGDNWIDAPLTNVTRRREVTLPRSVWLAAAQADLPNAPLTRLSVQFLATPGPAIFDGHLVNSFCTLDATAVQAGSDLTLSTLAFGSERWLEVEETILSFVGPQQANGQASGLMWAQGLTPRVRPPTMRINGQPPSTISAASPTDRLVVTWSPSPNGPRPSFYEVRVTTIGGSNRDTYHFITNSTTATIPPASLKQGTSYFILVRAWESNSALTSPRMALVEAVSVADAISSVFRVR